VIIIILSKKTFNLNPQDCSKQNDLDYRKLFINEKEKLFLSFLECNFSNKKLTFKNFFE